VNTATVHFNTFMRQMTEMSQRKKKPSSGCRTGKCKQIVSPLTI